MRPKYRQNFRLGLKIDQIGKNRQSPVYRRFSPLTTFTHENLKLHYFYFFFDFCLTLFSKDIENGNLNKKEITGKFILILTISCEQD